MKTAILKRLAMVALMAIGLCGANVASAAKSAKAIEYSDGRMVYYYDDVDHSSDANFVKSWNPTSSTVKSPTTTITTIVIDSSYADYQPTSLAYYFWGLKNATTIEGIENLDTSKAASMVAMFRACSALTTVDLSGFDTSNVTSMKFMFTSCSSLTELDIASFSCAKLTNVESMFNACSSLTTIYATARTDMSVATTVKSAFYSCTNRLKGDRGTVWSSGHVDGDYARLDGGTDAPGYFSRAYRTLEIDSSEFATKHVASVTVTTVPDGLVVEPTESGGTTYSFLYGQAINITYTAAAGSDFDGLATVTDARYAETGILKNAVLSGDDIPTATVIPQDVTLTVDSSEFAAKNIQGVVVRLAVDDSVVEPIEPGGTTYSIRANAGFRLVYQAADGVYFLVSSGNSGRILDSFAEDISYVESGIGEDTVVNNPPAAAETVYGSLVRGVVTPDDPGTLTLYAKAVKPVGRVYLRNAASGTPSWNGLTTVSRVVVDPSMGDYGLGGDGLQYLFTGLSAVTNIEGLANLDTSKATNFTQMFSGCAALESLDLHSFRTENVKSWGNMFYDCKSLTELDLSSFSSSSASGCDNMFRNCSQLVTIYTRADFDLSVVTGAWMFWNASKLVGGMGTAMSVVKTQDSSCARVDGGTDAPGLFTLKLQKIVIDDTDFAAKHVASVAVTRVTDGSAVEPDEFGVYLVENGEKVNITYTAADGYLFLSGSTFTDDSFAETGVLTDVALDGEAIPSGAPRRTLTVATADFAARHIAAVELETSVGTTLDPVSTDPNVYAIAEGTPFTVVLTAANGYCFTGIGRHQRIDYPTGITADETLDPSRIAPTEEVQDGYVIRYFDGKDNHISVRDEIYPYSETEAYALYNASSLAPVPNSSSYARFVGWCEQADRGDTPITSLPPLTLGDKTFYAKYEIGKTDWLTQQAQANVIQSNWTGNVIAHATTAKVTAGESYAVKMPYCILLPASFEPEKKYPLILHLHGAGSRGTQGQQFGTGVKQIVDYLRRQNIEAVIVSPQIPGEDGVFSEDGTLKSGDFVSEAMQANVPGSSQKYGPSWVDTPWMPKLGSSDMAATPTVWLQAAAAILEETLGNEGYQIDPDRVYAVGMSMGGYGTWEMLQRYPARFAAAVPCCGGADTNLAATIKDIPIWANHGGKDTTVYTLRSQAAVAALRAAGSRSVRYTEYGDDYTSGEGACSNHDCWDVTFWRDEVLDWMFAQVRGKARTTVTWTGGASGDWDIPSNWSPRAPQADDDVVIGSAATVRLSAATPRFNSVTIGVEEGTATLELSGWNTSLWTETLTVASNGVVTCAKGGETKGSLSRVWLKGYEVFVAQGGRIDASGKGYWKAATGQAGIGAGPAAGSGSVGEIGATGAAHGGYGGAFAAPSPLPYDDLVYPDDAGSSGGLSATSESVSAGGGVIFFELAGPLTVDGEILANADDTSKTGTNDGANDETAGAGGTIFAEVANLTTSGATGITGTLSANGGNSSCPYGLVSGRVGGGGRIALHYQTHVQTSTAQLDSRFPLTISAEHGLYRWIEESEEKSLTCVNIDAYGSQADLGTIWVPDNKLMGGFGRGLNGEIHAAVDWDDHSTQFTFRRGHARLTGDSSVRFFNPGISAGARLELGGGEAVNYAGGVRQRGDAAPIVTMFRPSNNSFGIAAGARLDVYAPKTEQAAVEATIGATGTVLTVAGTLRLWSDPETGVAPRIKVGSFVANKGSLVSAANAGLANEAGFGGGVIRLSAQSYDQKAGAVFSVAGGNGLVDIWSWQPVELGERVYTTDHPQKRFGQTFAGTFDLGENGRKQFSTLRGEAKGIMMLVR